MGARTLTIVQDSREKRPVKFPPTLEWTDFEFTGHVLHVKVVTKRLAAGDYCIEGYEALTAIERKGSLDELRQNLFTKDSKRASRALRRFAASCTYPYLLLDCDLMNFRRATTYMPDPALVQDFFFRELAALGLRLLWLPAPRSPLGRLAVGRILVRLMWAHVVQELGIL